MTAIAGDAPAAGNATLAELRRLSRAASATAAAVGAELRRPLPGYIDLIRLAESLQSCAEQIRAAVLEDGGTATQ